MKHNSHSVVNKLEKTWNSTVASLKKIWNIDLIVFGVHVVEEHRNSFKGKYQLIHAIDRIVYIV